MHRAVLLDILGDTGFLSHMLGTTGLFCFSFYFGGGKGTDFFFFIFSHIISKMGNSLCCSSWP